MPIMMRRWLVQRTNKEYVAYLAREAGVSQALAQILINRGVKDPSLAAGFLARDARPLSDPREIDGMAGAVSAIADARRRGARVFIHGDYDVDGITSTSIMVEALGRLGMDVLYFIPNRFADGYGFNPPAVERAAQAGAGLILTLDCGITSFEAVALAKERGIEVVITDHHEPHAGDAGPLRPEAGAIVNPKLCARRGGPAGLEHLSGAGVALKLLQALALEFPGALEPEAALDLAALGTLADSVPLLGENRTIVRRGIEDVFSGRRPGVRALALSARLNDRSRRSTSIPFTLIPRLNAPGRIDDATGVVELLLCADEARATDMAAILGRKNTERQKIEDGVLVEAMREIAESPPGAAIVLAREGWHEGVIGIVASRIAERFGRPAVIISVHGDTARGSGRSIEGFDLHEGLAACGDILLAYGGHRQAAGLRVGTNEIPRLRERLSEIAAAAMAGHEPTLNLDAAIELKEATPRLLEEVSALEPFGYGNPEPLLGAKGLDVLFPRVVGNNHLKLKLRANGYALDAIGYGMGDQLQMVEEAGRVDAAFTLTLNEWNGRSLIQLKLKALRETQPAD